MGHVELDMLSLVSFGVSLGRGGNWRQADKWTKFSILNSSRSIILPSVPASKKLKHILVFTSGRSG